MSEWKRVRIGDVLTLQRGFDITRASQHDGPVPVVSSGGISSFHDAAMVNAPGVVIGRKGTLGKVFYMTTDFWPHDTTLWVKDFKGSYPRFVYYFFLNFDVMGLDVGSANPTLNRNHVHPILVNWPSIREQVAISEVLGALDEKIAVNERIAATAEELASSIFRCSAAGTVELSSIVSLARSQVVPAGLTDETVDHYSLPAFDARKMPEVVAPGVIKSSKFLVDTPAVLLSKLNPGTPRVWCVDPAPARTSLASTEFLVLTPVDGVGVADVWAACVQPDVTEALAARASGTSNSHQRVKPSDVLASLVIDPRELSVNVRDIVASHVERARLARRETIALAELRDALLPKLMSGEIRVKDAERRVGEVV
jgi:type I restriction enzyme S subunit